MVLIDGYSVFFCCNRFAINKKIYIGWGLFMGTARSILEKMESDLYLLQSNIPLNDLDRRAFVNSIDNIRSALESALAIISPEEDWDVLGFQAFLLREREIRQQERNEAAISHLQTPLAS